MKASLTIILCGYIASASAGKIFGEKCEIKMECSSQHCVPICNSSENEKACIEPQWYYQRHEKSIPTCVDKNYPQRKNTSLAYAKPRRIGHSCHNDINCQSRHCVPTCDSKSTMWRCIEPRSFFESQRLDIPKCTDLDYVHPRVVEVALEESTEALTAFKPEVKKDPVSRKPLGQLCLNHSECFSKNCVSICDSSTPEKESRCIEPTFSFTMHNLPIPKCLNREAMESLVKDVDSTSASTVEELIWARLNFLKGKAPNDERMAQVETKSLSGPEVKVVKESKPANVPKPARKEEVNWAEFYSGLRGKLN